jgi:hypothetical protein
MKRALAAASLIMEPEGYADGLLPSIKPLNGSGDFTFSRGSNLSATRINQQGLIEKGRENLLTYSNTFSSWPTLNITSTSGQSGYDGSNNAWLLTDTATSGDHRLYLANSHSGVNTLSVYAKAGTKSIVYVQSYINNSSIAYFDLSSGSVLSTSVDIDSKIESVGNGWYRCSMAFNNTNTYVTIGIAESATRSYVGDGTGTIYIQDAQLEIGLAATDYIESGATTGKAGLLEDEPRLDYSGGATSPSLLLEPSRTNLVRSEYYGDLVPTRVTLTSNYGISPEGVQNAAAIFNTTENGRHNLNGSYFAVTSGTSYVNSVFAKAGTITKMKLKMFSGGGIDIGFNDGDFDLTNGTATGTGAGIESYGNGWYRCYVVDSPTSSVSNARFNVELLDANGNVSYVGSVTDYIEIFGSQIEQGSYPTSYIPNHSGGTITRGADDCSKTGISSLIGQTEGTLFWEGKKTSNLNFATALVIENGTTNRIYLLSGSTGFRVDVTASNTTTAFYSGTHGLGNYKIAIAYNSSSVDVYINGVSVFNDSSVTIPACQNVYLTNWASYNQSIETRQALLFKERLSNTDLAALTTI